MSSPGENPAGVSEVLADGPTIYCPKCEYNLTGLTRDVCPECGTPFDPAVLRWNALNDVQSLWKRTLRTLIFYAPAPVLLIPVYLEPAFVTVGNLIWNSDALGHAVRAWTLMIAAWAMYMSQHRGCRVARRYARRLPTDPATPTTLRNMAAFGVIYFARQLGVAVFVLAVFSNAISEMFPIHIGWMMRFGTGMYGFDVDAGSTRILFGLGSSRPFPLSAYAIMAIFGGVFILLRRIALAVFRWMMNGG